MAKIQFKAFTLAETMVVMLVLCIIVVAFAPVITRRKYNIAVSKNPSDYAAPAGTVMAYYGSTIPSGWVLCDGTNGTPDLRGYFIRGADSIASPNVQDSTSANKTHYHGLYSTNGGNGYYYDHEVDCGLANGSSVGFLGEQRFYDASGTWNFYVLDGYGNKLTTAGTDASGNVIDKNEFRPKNVALNFIMKT